MGEVMESGVFVGLPEGEQSSGGVIIVGIVVYQYDRKGIAVQRRVGVGFNDDLLQDGTSEGGFHRCRDERQEGG